MHKIALKISLLFALVFTANGVYATHLVGGSFAVKWLGGNSYEITLKVLRDCENGSPRAYFDFPLTAGIFNKTTHARQTSVTFTQNDFVKDDTLDFTGDNCPDIVTGCTHIGIYRKVVQLPGSQYNAAGGYYISWERCCRNNIISNIVKPEAAGMVLYTEFPNTQFIKNSSPYFTNNPVTLICANNLFKYNLEFKDDDGDNLVYSLIEPLNGNLGPDMPANNDNPRSGPYPTTVWQTGYNNGNVIPGIIPLTINPATGELSCNPISPGIFVASIRVEEFRFGQKIGEVRLELQFTVTNCPNQPPLSSIVTVNNQIVTDTIYIKIPEKLSVRIRSIDLTDSVTMRVSCELPDSLWSNKPIYDTLVKGLRVAETNFSWQSDCEHQLQQNAIAFNIESKDNGCPIPRNSSNSFYIKFIPRDVIAAPKMLCMTLIDNKETVFYWGNRINANNQDFKQYNIYKIVGSNSAILLDSITDLTARFYHDKQTPNYSTINYGYFIRTVNLCDSIGQPSDTIFTFDELKFIPDKQFFKCVTVENNKVVKITWPETWEKDFARYYLYKSNDLGVSYNLVKTFFNPADTQYVDEDVNVAKQPYCYYLVMQDTCDNVGPIGYESCSIHLTGEAGEFFNNLKWSAYSGWLDIESYQLMRSDPATPFTLIRNNSEQLLAATDDKLNLNEGLFKYVVVAKEAFANVNRFFAAESRSNEIDLVQKPMVYIPNAFTSNGDGLNDNYYWLPVFVKDFKLQIYNRWGERIFETTNKNKAWDGKYKGDMAPTGVYFYTLYYNGWEGTEQTKSGNFTLLR